MSAPPLADRITRLTAAAEGSGDPVVAGLVAVVAEQALRMVKPRMKISGGIRTWAGTRHFARVRGLLETTRKQGNDPLAVLQPDPVLP